MSRSAAVSVHCLLLSSLCLPSLRLAVRAGTWRATKYFPEAGQLLPPPLGTAGALTASRAGGVQGGGLETAKYQSTSSGYVRVQF